MGIFSDSLGWDLNTMGTPSYGGMSGNSPVAGTSALPTNTAGASGGGDYLESFLNFGLAALPSVLGAFVQPQYTTPDPYVQPGRNSPPQQVVVSGFNPMPLFFWGALAFGAYKLLSAK